MKRRFLGLSGALVVSAFGCGTLEHLGDPPLIVNPDASAPDASDGSDASAPDVSAPEASAPDASTPRFSLVAPGALTIAPGDSLAVAIALVANAPLPNVTITATGLPSQVTADPLVIAAGSTNATLTLRAAAKAPAFHGTITVNGTASTASATAPIPLDVRGRSGTLDAS